MCTLAFAYKVHPDYPMIFIGNRDEFYNRLTQNAEIWNGILSGIDLEKGGTWTGISQSGRMAFLTNYRDFSLHVENPESRGFLTKDFLTGNLHPEAYLKQIAIQKSRYNPYNLVVGDIENLYYYSNISDEIVRLKPGIYGLSNALLDVPWPKIQKIKTELSEAISSSNVDVEALFRILDNSELALDGELPSTGIEFALEKALSSIFIALEAYGTRYETIILTHRSGQVMFFEKSLSSTGEWALRKFQFLVNGGI